MAEGNDSKSTSDNNSTPISKSQLEINECLGSWFTYLQMLNGLCSAGTKLAQSLQTLISNQDAVIHCRLVGPCLAGWEELSRATGVASNTVKHHVIAALRDHESDVDKHYQFCVACCECLGGMAECSCSQSGKSECDIAALQQCFERLYNPPTPVSSSSAPRNRSPLKHPLFPLQVQRRWSETAAAEMSGESTESTMRRWSMPCRHVTEWPRPEEKTRLRVPFRDCSRSTTPDSVWKSSQMNSQDGLQEAIQLLSCRPGVRLSNQMALSSQHIPVGVTLTTCNFDGSSWPDSRRVGSSKGWPQDSHSSDHSDQSGPRDSEHRDSEQSGSGGSGDNDLPSRKSSSSDSCLSGNSRSGSESAGAGENSKSQLYSMWSGGDLPLIKLPESNEIQDKRPPTN